VFGCSVAPPSSSRPAVAFAPQLLLPIRHDTLTPPPSRGPWSACIRAVPSAAFSSTASNVHYARPRCSLTVAPPTPRVTSLHTVILHDVQLLLLFLLLDTRSLRPCRVTSAHVRAVRILDPLPFRRLGFTFPMASISSNTLAASLIRSPRSRILRRSFPL
jgi:hypothetical protein